MRRLLCWTFAVVMIGHTAASYACKPPALYLPFVNTPFLKAISDNNVAAVEQHLRDGANPNSSITHDSTTPVRVAVHARALEALRTLQKAGADIRADRYLAKIVYELPASPIEKATLVSMLAAMGLNVNIADGVHWSTLTAAVISQPIEVIQALVKAGADPNLGQPICTAARVGRADVFDFLLSNGARLLAACHGSGPLSANAVSSNALDSVQILRTLTDRRYVIDAQSLIHRVQLVEQARFLVSLGADPKRRLPDGSTVLHHAASADLVRYFAELGVDVNARDGQGNTALHKFAARALFPTSSCGGPNLEAWIVFPIRELLKHGANPGLYNAARKTPLELGVDKHYHIGAQLRELLQ